MWQDHVTTLVHVHNYNKSNATDFSPYYLMFGRKLRIPLGLPFGTNMMNMGLSTSTKYIQQLEKRLQWEYQKSLEYNKYQQIRNWWNYDRHVKCAKFNVEDKVLLWKSIYKRKHKVSHSWQYQVYIVISTTI